MIKKDIDVNMNLHLYRYLYSILMIEFGTIVMMKWGKRGIEMVLKMMMVDEVRL